MFEGQQEGERVLYTITPYVFAKYIALGKICVLALFLFIVTVLMGNVVPMQISWVLKTIGVCFSVVLFITGFMWNQKVFSQSKTYITDRRILRFEVMSPFFQTKRMLFWSEALKAKAYAPNLLYKFLNIGTIQVEPHLADGENVRITDVYFAEDLANYIDKILYTVKNKSEDIETLRPFVPKPRGQRYT